MREWLDTFHVRGGIKEVFCLVRDLNCPDLQDHNTEIKQVHGWDDTPTLCTPAKEYDTNPKDTFSWHRY